jgi:RNA polymerase sigma-70 factor (ECF subfamily)
MLENGKKYPDTNIYPLTCVYPIASALSKGLIDENMYVALPEVMNITSEQSQAGSRVQEHTELRVLINECLGKSRSAQKKLYDTYSPAAYSVIRRYVQNDAIAQEALNDAFFKIFTKLDQYSFQGAFEGWIRRIVVNTVTDHLRKNIKDGYNKEITPEDAHVESEPVGNIAFKEMLKLVQELPDTQRAVFNLFVFENYSHKEIAEVLGLNENNSRWHLNDARKRLKDKLNAITNK